MCKRYLTLTNDRKNSKAGCKTKSEMKNKKVLKSDKKWHGMKNTTGKKI